MRPEPTATPDPFLDRTVAAASFDPGRRELVVRFEGGGLLRYRRVSALATTHNARMATPEWVQDALPQTLLSERVADCPRAEAGRGLTWLLGDARAFEGAPLREAVSFTGGRWFRLFVGAAGAEVEGGDGRPWCGAGGS